MVKLIEKPCQELNSSKKNRGRRLKIMAIKLIEYRVNGSKNKSHKRLTESFGNEDVYIVSLDEVIEGMGGNATDEDINNSLKIFNFIKHQLKTPRLQDLLYVRVSDELAWELEELSQAKNINSFKNSEVQILQMTTEDYGPIIFAIERLDGVYDPVFYFKSEEDVSNIVKWVHTQFPDEE